MRGPGIGAMDNVPSRLEIVPALPLLVGELVVLEDFLLGAATRPSVEEVALPAVGSHQEVLRSLAIRVAVKLGDLHERSQDSAAFEQIMVVAAERITALGVVGGSGLWNERIDVVKLPPDGEQLDVEAGDV